MIYQVHMGRSFWLNIEAPTPEAAACKAVSDVEHDRNEFRVGCGGEERAVRVNPPDVVVVVRGRTLVQYEGEVQV
jgi:hypothetical protein